MMRSDSRIDFVGGIRGLELERLVNSGEYKATFALYPTSMEDLQSQMPEKSCHRNQRGLNRNCVVGCLSIL